MKSIELFAGAGGLGMGIKRAGFKQIAALEKNPQCCQSILSNKNAGVFEVADWNIFNDDVANFEFKRHEGKVDLISGGPPCQPFSLGGRHLGHLDSRDSFPEAIRAIREVKPSAFIFENVRGLTRKTFSNYFQYIILQLSHPEVIIRKSESLLSHLCRLEKVHTRSSSPFSYNVVTRILNAADFGVAQKRDRVFIVGFRSDIDANWSFPDATHSETALHWSQLFGDYWDRHEIAKKNRSIKLKSQNTISFHPPQCLPWLTVRDVIHDLPDPEKSPRKAKAFPNHIFQAGARAYLGHNGSRLDEPAKTLKAGDHGVPGGENAIRRFDGSLRYFTIRESARLQGFPDDYIFSCSWGQAMKQLGNAVPVTLAEFLGKSIRRALK
jgi:DNA (cytosine-5)-methyltransferase 1